MSPAQAKSDRMNSDKRFSKRGYADWRLPERVHSDKSHRGEDYLYRRKQDRSGDYGLPPLVRHGNMTKNWDRNEQMPALPRPKSKSSISPSHHDQKNLVQHHQALNKIVQRSDNRVVSKTSELSSATVLSGSIAKDTSSGRGRDEIKKKDKSANNYQHKGTKSPAFAQVRSSERPRDMKDFPLVEAEKFECRTGILDKDKDAEGIASNQDDMLKWTGGDFFQETNFTGETDFEKWVRSSRPQSSLSTDQGLGSSRIQPEKLPTKDFLEHYSSTRIDADSIQVTASEVQKKEKGVESKALLPSRSNAASGMCASRPEEEGRNASLSTIKVKIEKRGSETESETSVSTALSSECIDEKPQKGKSLTTQTSPGSSSGDDGDDEDEPVSSFRRRPTKRQAENKGNSTSLAEQHSGSKNAPKLSAQVQEDSHKLGERTVVDEDEDENEPVSSLRRSMGTPVPRKNRNETKLDRSRQRHFREKDESILKQPTGDAFIGGTPNRVNDATEQIVAGTFSCFAKVGITVDGRLRIHVSEKLREVIKLTLNTFRNDCYTEGLKA
eukprot:CAMPEP_0184483908 /NCGR_PEP_ID=MMETSP0113_2-20130426/5586_1 /TAXON_ID=91329 /ORGANISM="Norrisiella sphaerica, Strain BC52" /LENGTH=553 /DNA_ID=CAMNT_0026864579 /DNA_START=388 /DNA_END=2045 /DNA_ORIENTATION=+